MPISQGCEDLRNYATRSLMVTSNKKKTHNGYRRNKKQELKHITGESHLK